MLHERNVSVLQYNTVLFHEPIRAELYILPTNTDVHGESPSFPTNRSTSARLDLNRVSLRQQYPVSLKVEPRMRQSRDHPKNDGKMTLPKVGVLLSQISKKKSEFYTLNPTP